MVTVVIPTRGCTWALSKNGGCSMCGYVNDSSRDRKIPFIEILKKIEDLLGRSNPEKQIEVRLFNSGSFFDKTDVPEELRNQIIHLIRKSPNVRSLVVESRAKHLLQSAAIIKNIKEELDPIVLEIGVGFETFNDAILRDCWNKGTSLELYKKGVTLIRSLGVRIKSYILIKPPFLTEAESIVDAIETSREAARIGTDVISFNPCNVQNGTLVHYLFKRDQYQPPWLWSILYILMVIRSEFPDLEIICEPSGAGKPRGTHNCKKCNKSVLKMIDQIIIGGNITKDFSEVCSCYLNWKKLVYSPIEVLRTRNLSKLRRLDPLKE